MGPDVALAWAEEQDGIEALVLEPTKSTNNDSRLSVRMTSGLRDRVISLAPDAVIQ